MKKRGSAKKTLSKQTWDQLKNITADKLIKALKKIIGKKG